MKKSQLRKIIKEEIRSVLNESVNESKSSNASEELITLLKTHKPLLAFLKWTEILVSKYNIDSKKAKQIMDILYNIKGQINLNHLKQIANKELKGVVESKIGKNKNYEKIRTKTNY